MKEIIILSTIYILFLIASVLFQKAMIKVNTKWLYLYIPAYLLAIILYFDLAVRFHQLLRDNKIYLEFGHADILLLELMASCYLTALGFIIYIFYSRRKKYRLAPGK